MKALRVSLLALLLSATLAYGQGPAFFSVDQTINITGPGRTTRTYIMDITNFRNLVISPVRSGNYSVTYPLYYDIWYGMLVYDFAYGDWSDLMWAFNSWL